MTSGNKGSGPGKAALAVALVAPAIALAAAVAIRVTGVGRDLAFDLAVMTVGRTIAWGAAVLAVMALVHALGDLKRRGLQVHSLPRCHYAIPTTQWCARQESKLRLSLRRAGSFR